MEKGIIKIYNHPRGNGYIERPDGTLIEFQLSHSRDLKPQAIELGAIVEFELGKMPKGELVAMNVKIVAPPTPEPTRQPRPREQRADHPAPGLPQRDARAARPREPRTIRQPAPTPPRQPQSAAAPSQADSAPQFLNPYNFVRYLERADDPTDPREVKLLGRCVPPPHDRWVGLSGKIVCDAKAVTPLFVADAEEITGGEHKTYRFFKFNDAPAIPASSLRGMTRAVFEAITNSCYAVFDESPLSYHLESTLASWLVPARVEKKEDEDKWQLRLLTGAAPLQVSNSRNTSRRGDQYAAWMRSFWPIKASKTLRREGPRLSKDKAAIREAFVLRTEDETNRNPDGVKHGEPCCALLRQTPHAHPEITFWDVIQIRKAGNQAALEKMKLSDDKIVGGWICLTNKNIEAKHSERFFFRDKDKAKGPETINLPEHARIAYEKLIADYQDRHAKDVRKRAKCSEPEGDKPAFSRFVCDQTERKLVGGELVYAMLNDTVDEPRVEFIAPVSVPRLWYKKSRSNLLKPEALHHCTDRQALCPACRTFGWVRGERDEEGAYASRVRFSHAIIAKSNPIAPMTLAILGEPKPTTTRFYLVGPDGKPAQGRDDQTIGYDGNAGRNRLRGRKFYRHHRVNDHSTVSKDKESDQNRTIADPQGAGAEFSFTVHFENLAPVELGALLWSLEIGGAGYHRLGYGKPLGLGSVEVNVRTVTLRDHAARYAALTESGDMPETNWKTYVDDFKKFAAKRWGKDSFAELDSAQDLLAIVNRADPTLPVRYPHSPASDSQGAFEWFVGNKSKRGPKVELALAAEDKGLPLIDKKGNQYATGECAK